MRNSDSITKLLDHSGCALSVDYPILPPDLLGLGGSLVAELIELLKRRNGFYAFANALHVFPAGKTDTSYDLAAWNHPELWRSGYADLGEGCLFFAEGLFGDQYAIRSDKIYWFDLETGEMELIADTIFDWIDYLVHDPDSTGYSTAVAWQREYGPIPEGKRLFPKIPFVFGGEIEWDNLYLGDPVERLHFGGYTANQIRNIPNGTKIKIQVVE
jgi:hypothetical protein